MRHDLIEQRLRLRHDRRQRATNSDACNRTSGTISAISNPSTTPKITSTTNADSQRGTRHRDSHAHRGIEEIGDDAARDERQQDRAQQIEQQEKHRGDAEPEQDFLPRIGDHGLISAPASERAQRTR